VKRLFPVIPALSTVSTVSGYKVVLKGNPSPMYSWKTKTVFILTTPNLNWTQGLKQSGVSRGRLIPRLESSPSVITSGMPELGTSSSPASSYNAAMPLISGIEIAKIPAVVAETGVPTAAAVATNVA